MTDRHPMDCAEEWRRVPDFDEYEVSSLGRVRRGDRELKPLPTGQGYVAVAFYPGPKGGHRRYIHRTVLNAFVGPCPDGYTAAHLNGIRTDNRRENLAWTTVVENLGHKKLHGTQVCGEGVWNAKLTASQVSAARRRLAAGESRESIGRDYGVDRQTIRDIELRRTWRHVG